MTKPKYNKHQKLPIQEANWKWEYLVKKYQNSDNITSYTELELIKTKSEELVLLKDNTQAIELWVENHLNPNLVKKLDQAIRRKRKRFFDNEKLYSSKKMVELEYEAWNLLSIISKAKNISLSQVVVELAQQLDKHLLQEYKQKAKENSEKR